MGLQEADEMTQKLGHKISLELKSYIISRRHQEGKKVILQAPLKCPSCNFYKATNSSTKLRLLTKVCLTWASGSNMSCANSKHHYTCRFDHDVLVHSSSNEPGSTQFKRLSGAPSGLCERHSSPERRRLRSRRAGPTHSMRQCSELVTGRLFTSFGVCQQKQQPNHSEAGCLLDSNSGTVARVPAVLTSPLTSIWI